MRQEAKQFLRRSLGRVAPLSIRFRKRPALLVLMYHRILPPGHPARALEQPGMYVSPESLAMHLRVLAGSFEIVELGDWLSRQAGGRSLPERACCITFDDGWRDNHDYGLPVLQAAGAPATVFLVADAIGQEYRFWPNRLAELLGSLPPDRWARLPPRLLTLLSQAGIQPGKPGADATGRIDAAITACKHLPDDVLVGLLDEAEALAAAPAARGGRDLLDRDEILAMRSTGLVQFGSHSRRHTRLLSGLTAAQLDDEVRGSRASLEALLDQPVQTFCYPNGDYSPEALAVVRRTYTAAVTTVPGWNEPGCDLHQLRRMAVHEDIAADELSFLARIAGLR